MLHPFQLFFWIDSSLPYLKHDNDCSGQQTWVNCVGNLRGIFTCGVNILCPSTLNMIKPLDCCFKSICIDFVFGHYMGRLDPKMGWITDNIILKNKNWILTVYRSFLPVYHLRLAQYQRLVHYFRFSQWCEFPKFSTNHKHLVKTYLGRSEKFGCLPKSALFFWYTYWLSIFKETEKNLNLKKNFQIRNPN